MEPQKKPSSKRWILWLSLSVIILVVIAALYYSQGKSKISQGNSNFSNKTSSIALSQLRLQQDQEMKREWAGTFVEPLIDDNLQSFNNYLSFSEDAIANGRRKECEKGKVVKRAGAYHFSLGSADIFVRNQKVVGVGNLQLSSQTLAAITEAFIMLDDALYQNCLNLHDAWSQQPPDKDILILLIQTQKDYVDQYAKVASILRENRDDSAIKAKVDSTKENIKEEIEKSPGAKSDTANKTDTGKSKVDTSGDKNKTPKTNAGNGTTDTAK